jgi:hypothetical protein
MRVCTPLVVNESLRQVSSALGKVEIHTLQILIFSQTCLLRHKCPAREQAQMYGNISSVLCRDAAGRVA